MNFTLRQISYFLAVARLRNFGRAAEASHISQPGLSSQIAQLEARLGGALFERGAGSGPVRLTALGERLLPAAQDLIDGAQRLDALSRAGREPLSGRLRLAIIPTVAPYLIPHLVPALRESHPALELELHEVVTDDLVAGVASHRFDAGLMALPTEPALQAEPVLRDGFLIAMSEDDTTYLSGPARPESLAVERLLLLAEGHCLRDQALEVCGLRNARRKLNLEAASMATLMRMVASGMGMTLIPELALKDENRDGRLRIVPFAEPAPSRDLAVVWRAKAEAETDARALAGVIRGLAPVLGVAPISS
ncbi:hydrogen peroxide-inducible genes activator [Paracoccus laeviglucosivorans]|uniref:LysR family transcriptional regulator, hydrogen peroxide-inducible genes activator n=1 Tax=Paracoccus laeviglucosivorans TaxID=1197861 RepID=A0A521EZ44_9RHOB|nr:hydrogen peroxide-inducible genes activator [Paracoccus laeviglucosivorans]SMO88440.1 LysR family transcriptional regulator, hydrogen peroxide-inducible genes activator [Paracoccus laeviglucosivorans]